MEGLIFFLALVVILFYFLDVRPRLRSLEERLGQLERKASGLAAQDSGPAELSRLRPSRAPSPDPQPRPPPRAPEPSLEGLRRVVDLEALIGGRWLNYIGILALLFGAAFFLKHAFENDWIGEQARIFIGVICGIALIAYSQRLWALGYRFFSEGIAGLGAALLFLSIYAGWGFYRLFPQAAAFTGMVAVCGLTIVLALIRDSQRIGIVALVGGFLTPVLLATGEDRQVILFVYLLILNTSLLALAWARQWGSLDLLSFLGTQFLFWGWYNNFYSPSKLVPTFIFACIFFLQFAALPAIRAIRKETVSGSQTFLILANVFWFLVALNGIFWPGHRWKLAATLAVLAAAHSAASRKLRSPAPNISSPVSLLYGGLAITLATLIIPVLLHGQWMTIAWAIESALLVWSGFRANIRYLRGTGLLLFGLVAFRLAAFPIASDTFVLNARFATFLVTVLCFAIAFWLARRRTEALDQAEQILFPALGAAVNILTLWALSLELWDLFGRPGIRFVIPSEAGPAARSLLAVDVLCYRLDAFRCPAEGQGSTLAGSDTLWSRRRESFSPRSFLPAAILSCPFILGLGPCLINHVLSIPPPAARRGVDKEA